MVEPCSSKEATMNRRTITREELYSLVWQTPMRKLAAEFGISDVALGKICKKLGVPKPGLGYWTQASIGKASPPPSLPPSEGFETSYTIYPPDASANPKSESLSHFKAKESKVGNKIKVESELSNPHPWVLAAQKALKLKPGPGGFINATGAKSPSLVVSPGQAARTIRILDAFLKGLESRGIRFWIKDYKTWVQYDGEDIQINNHDLCSK
jgi:hypothetical protein